MIFGWQNLTLLKLKLLETRNVRKINHVLDVVERPMVAHQVLIKQFIFRLFFLLLQKQLSKVVNRLPEGFSLQFSVKSWTLLENEQAKQQAVQEQDDGGEEVNRRYSRIYGIQSGGAVFYFIAWFYLFNFNI